MDLTLRTDIFQGYFWIFSLFQTSHYPQYKSLKMNVICLIVSMETLPHCVVETHFPGFRRASLPSDLCCSQICCLFSLIQHLCSVFRILMKKSQAPVWKGEKAVMKCIVFYRHFCTWSRMLNWEGLLHKSEEINSNVQEVNAGINFVSL